MAKEMVQSLLLAVMAFSCMTEAFYVPGVAPTDYSKGEDVEIKAVKLTSVKAQLPYNYYSLPFCVPEKLKYFSENLGEVLRGDRIANTVYQVKMAENKGCTVLCNKVKFTKEESKLVAKRIRQEYNAHLLTDNLPCATKFQLLETGEIQYEHGYKLGFVKNEKAYLHNHLKLVLKYHTEDNVVYRVVGFEVEPASINTPDMTVTDNTCSLSADKAKVPQEISETGETEVLFTYSVDWQESEV